MSLNEQLRRDRTKLFHCFDASKGFCELLLKKRFGNVDYVGQNASFPLIWGFCPNARIASTL